MAPPRTSRAGSMKFTTQYQCPTWARGRWTWRVIRSRSWRIAPGDCPLGRDAAHGVKRFLKPVAEEAAAERQVEHPVLQLGGLHAEGGVDEGALLRLGQRSVDEGSGVHAADQEVLAVLHLVDADLHFVRPAGHLDHLAIGAARLQPLALDGEDPRPPLRMAVRIRDLVPDHLDGRLDVCLLTDLRHAAVIMAPPGRCRQIGAHGGPLPLPIIARKPATAPETTLQQMQIYGVSFDMVGKQPIVLLKTVDGNRFLPIWIGHPEAAAILMKLQGA